MRRPERIPITLKIFESDEIKKQFIEHIYNIKNQAQLDLFYPQMIDSIIENWNINSEIILLKWQIYPDFRLGQFLIFIDILPDKGKAFWIEEESYLINEGIVKPRDIIFWGVNYDKDKNKLPETKWVLIKDMSTSHIEAIIREVTKELIMPISEFYFKIFIEELVIRKNANN